MTREEKEDKLYDMAMEDPSYYIGELIEGLEDWYLNELLGINEEEDI